MRDAIARAWLDQETGDSHLGEVTLHPHQVAAVGRIREVIQEFRGALLCDAVGLGKTYVALALAREFENTCVVAPASLREMWRSASRTARVPVTFVSTESLSRRDVPAGAHDMIVVDEAHRFRNRAAARYSRLVALTRDAEVLLLSATPIHNRRQDLTTLMELFLGSSALTMPESEIARLVIRRDVADVGGGQQIPTVQPVVRIAIGDDMDRLRAIVALPPPLPPAGGGLAPALTTMTLLRLWSSSDAAFSTAVRKRLARAISMRASLEAGKRPTEAELRSWVYADGAVQLGFADMLSSTAVAENDGLLRALAKHESGLRALHENKRVRLDNSRVESLLNIRRCHPAAKIVAFTQFAETAAAFYRAMQAVGGVGMLTATGGHIASGRISRNETLERFAPAANGVPPPPRASAIDLLFTTDVLSEGVNLQDASVVVHLDLPWTATALEQRVGRLARIGSRHREVIVYAFDPPASASDLIRAERIIRFKAQIAVEALGISRIPSLFSPPAVGPRSIVEEREEIRRILRSWTSDRIARSAGGTMCAGVVAKTIGLLALVSVDGRLELLADDGSGISPDPRTVRRVLSAASGRSIPCRPERLAGAEKKLTAWWEAETARRDAGCASGVNDPLRRTLFVRLAAIVRGLPRHEQQRQAGRIGQIRSRLEGRLSAGTERDLHELTRAAPSASRWLERAETILLARDSLRPVVVSDLRISAILLLNRRTGQIL